MNKTWLIFAVQSNVHFLRKRYKRDLRSPLKDQLTPPYHSLTPLKFPVENVPKGDVTKGRAQCLLFHFNIFIYILNNMH